MWLRVPVVPRCTSPELLNGHFGFQESTHKASLGQCRAGPGTPVWAGQAELRHNKLLQSLISAQGAATPPNVCVTGVPPS